MNKTLLQLNICQNAKSGNTPVTKEQDISKILGIK